MQLCIILLIYYICDKEKQIKINFYIFKEDKNMFTANLCSFMWGLKEIGSTLDIMATDARNSFKNYPSSKKTESSESTTSSKATETKEAEPKRNPNEKDIYEHPGYEENCIFNQTSAKKNEKKKENAERPNRETKDTKAKNKIVADVVDDIVNDEDVIDVDVVVCDVPEEIKQIPENTKNPKQETKDNKVKNGAKNITNRKKELVDTFYSKFDLMSKCITKKKAMDIIYNVLEENFNLLRHYILFSNVENNYSEEELEQMATNFDKTVICILLNQALDMDVKIDDIDHEFSELVSNTLFKFIGGEDVFMSIVQGVVTTKLLNENNDKEDMKMNLKDSSSETIDKEVGKLNLIHFEDENEEDKKDVKTSPKKTTRKTTKTKPQTSTATTKRTTKKKNVATNTAINGDKVDPFALKDKAVEEKK